MSVVSGLSYSNVKLYSHHPELSESEIQDMLSPFKNSEKPKQRKPEDEVSEKQLYVSPSKRMCWKKPVDEVLLELGNEKRECTENKLVKPKT